MKYAGNTTLNAAWMLMWAMLAELLLIVMIRGAFLLPQEPTIDPLPYAALKRDLRMARADVGKWQVQAEQAETELDQSRKSIRDLQARLEDGRRHLLLLQGGCRPVNGIELLCPHRTDFVNGISQKIEDSPQGLMAHGHPDGGSCVHRPHAPHQRIR